MTNSRPTVPDRNETYALMVAMDDQAEAYLVACVTFAKFMQTEVEFGMASDILKGMCEETYARLAYYEKRVDPISGKPAPTEPPDDQQPTSTTVRFAR